MKKSLTHLVERKRDELKKLVDIIRDHAEVEMIILFGSHARGTDEQDKEWVEHKYIKENVLYEYRSDFDILIIVKDEAMEKDHSIWDTIEAKAYENGIQTWLGIIVDHIDYVNKQLELGRYFYSDIKKEGIMLYDSKNQKLAKARKLILSEQKTLAQKDFNYWFESAHNFFEDAQENIAKKRYNNAAFYLHQAAERTITALLLVFTGYRPKTHDLKKLLQQVNSIAPDIHTLFLDEKMSESEQKLFALLRKAYVDARYEKSYTITQDQLNALSQKVKQLAERVRKLCQQKIESISSSS